MNFSFSFWDLKYLAEECARQKSGEMSVYYMGEALGYFRIKARNEPISLVDLRVLASMVNGVWPSTTLQLREFPVMIGNQVLLDWQLIPQALDSLLSNGSRLSPIEWYKEFEIIHPFMDGNGRVGSLVFNFLNDTLNRPIAPPNVFKEHLTPR